MHPARGRELQDIICSRTLWDTFQPVYGTKEALSQKFGQLAELRNGIRHSRSIDPVALKEGEAAILWFARSLDKR